MGRSGSAAGYSQKVHSFSKYVTPRITFGSGKIVRSTELKNEAGATVTISLYSPGAGTVARLAEILPNGMFFPIGIVRGPHSPCASGLSPATIRQTAKAFSIGSAP